MDKTETLAWLRRISGDLASATIQRLEEQTGATLFVRDRLTGASRSRVRNKQPPASQDAGGLSLVKWIGLFGLNQNLRCM